MPLVRSSRGAVSIATRSTLGCSARAVLMRRYLKGEVSPMPALHLPVRCKAVKRLLPSDDVEIDPVTADSVQAAKEQAWRERYAAQFETGVLITEDGRVILPSPAPQEN
jgi:hypothetical protein